MMWASVKARILLDQLVIRQVNINVWPVHAMLGKSLETWPYLIGYAIRYHVAIK